MKPEQLVPDLKLCQRLQELGWPQKDSCFWWARVEGSYGADGENGLELIWAECEGDCFNWRYKIKSYELAAPTVSELWEALPERITVDHKFYYFHVVGKMHGYFNLDRTEFDSDGLFSVGKKRVNAFAKCLIWLCENGHLDLKDLK